MQTERTKKVDIVTAGQFCEWYVSKKFPIQLSDNPYDSEKDGVFTADGPFYKKGDPSEIKFSNTWFQRMSVTTPYKGQYARNTIKCTSGEACLLFLNYQTEYMLHGKLHPYAAEYWDVIRILRIIDPTKYRKYAARIYEYGRPTERYRESLCWSITDNAEVVYSEFNPELANRFRKYSNATAR